MKKYYIGLFIIGILALGVSGYVLSIGVQARQDVKTEKSAQDIANKLNEYINNKQTIPATLSEAGVHDVPSTISYNKLSEAEYKFCITYKAAKGYGGSSITTAVTGAALSQMYNTPSYTDTTYPSTEPSSLYPDYTHKKGENCQTIKPYLYNNSYTNPPDYCSPSYQYYQDYKSYCESQTTSPSTTLQ
jgi:type II secretory pathway pseudopilin PulG